MESDLYFTKYLRHFSDNLPSYLRHSIISFRDFSDISPVFHRLLRHFPRIHRHLRHSRFFVPNLIKSKFRNQLNKYLFHNALFHIINIITMLHHIKCFSQIFSGTSPADSISKPNKSKAFYSI